MSALINLPPTPRGRRLQLVSPSTESAASLGGEVGNAERIQHALSTADHLTVGGVTAASHSHGLYGPGGDLVDLIESDGKLIAVLGDVSGKGVAASLVAAVMVSSFQHHVATHGAEAGVLLSSVDTSVRAMLDRTGAIVTLAIVVVDPKQHLVSIASAGHHPVVMSTPMQTRRLGPTCPPLGAAGANPQPLVADFPAGSSLIMVSDGVTEQPNLLGEEFGLSRLDRLAEDARLRSSAAGVSRVMHAVDFYADGMPPIDDRAVVVINARVP